MDDCVRGETRRVHGIPFIGRWVSFPSIGNIASAGIEKTHLPIYDANGHLVSADKDVPVDITDLGVRNPKIVAIIYTAYSVSFPLFLA